ncbi:putative membrane protein/putative copper resistance protein D [Actinopolymorpha cephalotaxi]|nr:cytochrome c oxidase assembly protein [Actinopolymorpha cephalotaxi]SFH03677.1 putative membrane protein/putative copper resistance protein D [Actinopolymorpha cephalotaxi]
MGGMNGGISGGMSGPMWMPMLAPTLSRLLAWHPQPVPVFPAGCAIALLAYTFGMVVVWRRGVRWPVGRWIVFAAGLLTVVAVTGTGVGGYGMELFSVHMVQHMVLSMLSPVLLLLGAPVTLALRALRPAPRGRRGPREVLLAVLHSRVARVLASPFFNLPLFLVSLYGLYFTPVFDAAMSNWAGHNLMLVHFLAVGLLFFWPILGVDPGPHRVSHPVRLAELFVGVPFHAVFGIAVMMSSGLIAGFFAHPPAAWGVSPLQDQSTGGGIAWAFTEVPTALVLVVVFLDWWRSDQRLARRTDRAADRDDDAELTAYNARLHGLAQRSPHDR